MVEIYLTSTLILHNTDETTPKGCLNMKGRSVVTNVMTPPAIFYMPNLDLDTQHFSDSAVA